MSEQLMLHVAFAYSRKAGTRTWQKNLHKVAMNFKKLLRDNGSKKPFDSNNHNHGNT